MNIAAKSIAVLLLSFCAVVSSVFAAFDPVGEDIDIFLANPAAFAQRSNVLILLDNTANWNTPFDVEKTALVTVVNSLTDGYNVGLMMFPETGSPNDATDGGYVRFGVRQMTADNKTAFSGMVNNLDKIGDKGNNATFSLLMYEAYAYFAGIPARAGFGKVKRDYAGNTSHNPLAANLPGNAFTSAASVQYVSPITNACQKNFIIVISNGPASDNVSSLAAAETLLTGISGGAPTTIAITPNGEQNNWMDEYAKFMANNDCNANFEGIQSVVTYTVDVNPGSTGQGPSHTALLKSAAAMGKGKYASVDASGGAEDLIAKLKAIFQEIQSVNSVFASTTLPVSVNVRGTNLNQVYIGVFRPDPNKAPRWYGNLKLYDLAVNSATGTLFLADAAGAVAENAATGFISNSAKSFWSAESCYWYFWGTDPNSTATQPSSCTVPTSYKYWSDLPDGDKVEKGGAAQILRNTYPDTAAIATRKLYTCTGTCTTGSDLSGSQFVTSNANITAGDLGTYVTKPVITLVSSGSTATATVTGHGFASGNSVTVSGASPEVYNGTFSITVVDANTFTYPLSSSPSGNTASVVATNHGLNTGDLVTVTGSAQAGYNVADTAVTKVNSDSFTYPLGAAVTGASSGHSVAGKKLVSSLTGLVGASSTAVTANVPVHNYPNSASVTITGATPAEFNGTYTITVGTDPNTFTYNAPITAAAATTARVNAIGHGFVTGDTVTIAGASLDAYNGSFLVTVIDANTFTYTLPSTQILNPTGTITASKPGVTLSATSVTHPTTGSAKDTATVTTAAAHNLSPGDVVTISGANQREYNGPRTLVSASGTTFTYVNDGIVNAATPATGTMSATVGATTRSITSITHPTGGSTSAKSVATVTSAAHGFAVNDVVTITGATQNQYNGTWVITAVTTNTFTYVNEGINVAATPATGTVSVSASISRTVNSIQRVVSGSGTIHAAKAIATTSVSTQTNATGSIVAGRKTDADTAARTNLINWVRGEENAEDENADTVLSNVRSSIHGDVLHSRPAVINYNRFGTDNDVFVFYGANDGIFHAVQGGFASNGGTEVWGFVAQESFSKLRRLRDNTPTINSTAHRDYFFDGPIGVYTRDVNSDGRLISSDGDKVWLFIGMRRGGRYIYALDVSDPANPKFLWKKGCPNTSGDDGCDTGYEKIGQTWSEPKVAYLRAFPATPVLIFGGGYDTAPEDPQPCLVTANDNNGVTARTGGTVIYSSNGTCTHSGTSSQTFDRTKGRSIYVVRATDGTVLWRGGPDSSADLVVSGMDYSIAADLTILNRDRDTTRTLTGKESVGPGFSDRIYAVDTGGNLWRADVDSASPASWTITKLASVSGSGLDNKRKFQFAPDVVFSSDSLGRYDAVLVGSGDREHPFDATITNRFYMFKDRSTGLTTNTSGLPITESDLFDATNNCLQDSGVCNDTQQSSASANLLSSKGWFVTLGAGEKTVGTATTISGTTLFNTNQPSATAGGGACGANLGIARSYLLSYKDATATTDLNATGTVTTADRFQTHAGGGYLPSPVPVIVTIGGKKYQAVISGTSVQNPGGLTLETRIRTYWRRKID
ncbi:MAG: hypothetical protein HY661_08295 [Betaproteobacteria bacterium]|nr:hypothetical protein [Betaproteobacteria bacterium]